MRLIKIVLLLLLFPFCFANGQNGLKTKSHRVILKLDDLVAKDEVINAIGRVMDYCIKNNIKAAFGVFNMGSVTDSQKTRLLSYMNAKNDRGEPLFELWHHGLDHSKDNPAGTQEYKGTGYTAQKEHFEKGDRIVKEKLGIQMHTFGAPYNASDSATGRVISENKNYNVDLFGSWIPRDRKDLINMNQRVNMESATGVVEMSCFEKEFALKKDRFPDVMILQGHPAKWGDVQMAEFDKIVKKLQKEGYTFVLPYEYYMSTL